MFFLISVPDGVMVNYGMSL